MPEGAWSTEQTPHPDAACKPARVCRQATVGAGLPVLSTLQTLRATGDRVERIEGVLSGTLSYLFNTFAPGQRFSALVADARRQGFTEPDPRDDLSGVMAFLNRHPCVVCKPCSVYSVFITRPWHMGQPHSHLLLYM